MAGRPFRWNIARKMLLGYLPLVLLSFLIASFALVSLDRLNRMLDSIVSGDVPQVEAADRMVDDLLAQDSYGRRHVILGDPDLAAIFWERSAAFERTLGEIRAARGPDDPWVRRLAELHAGFNRLFSWEFEDVESPPGQLDRAREIERIEGEILGAIRSESTALRRARDRKTHEAARIGSRAYRVTAVLWFLGVLVAGGASLAVARHIGRSVRRLVWATGEVSEGRFDRVPEVRSRDELGDLADAFRQMAVRLARMEAMCLDASPLTRLPGGEAIEQEVRRRLESGRTLAFCMLDLDNFKAFSDRYGYANGSEVIKALARMLEDVVVEKGTREDFVGHIGGDDFVLLTVPDRFRDLCQEVIDRFDREIPSFYSEEDRDRGYIRGKTRQGEVADFPLMTLSIAVVVNPERRGTNPMVLGEVAAELKEEAKAVPGSVYLVREGTCPEGAT